MPDLLIRDLPPEVVERLKQKAARRQRSLQQELRRIVIEAAGEDVEELVDRIRERRVQYEAGGKTVSDSVELLRRDRQR